jgi:hypothetical protein
VGDYWRFAPQGIASLLGRHFGDGVEVVEYGNLTAALALLQGFAVEDLPSPNLLAPVDPDYPVVMGFWRTGSPERRSLSRDIAIVHWR